MVFQQYSLVPKSDGRKCGFRSAVEKDKNQIDTKVKKCWKS